MPEQQQTDSAPPEPSDDPYPELTETLTRLIEKAPSPWAVVSSLVNACYNTPGPQWQNTGDLLYEVLGTLEQG